MRWAGIKYSRPDRTVDPLSDNHHLPPDQKQSIKMLFTKAALGAVLAQSAAARYNNVLYWVRDRILGYFSGY